MLLDLNEGIGTDGRDVFKADVFETHSAVSVGEHPVLGLAAQQNGKQHT